MNEMQTLMVKRLTEMIDLIQNGEVKGLLIAGLSSTAVTFAVAGEIDIESAGQALDELWEVASGADTPSAPDLGYRMGMH